uniref:Uncharacterized protein n=1 Tax=Anopheles culicifacies TaxID=139723 RepID=A0A182MM56_9DIPT
MTVHSFAHISVTLYRYRRDKTNKPIPRSSSIDSMVDAVWSEFPPSAPGSARNSVSTQIPSNLNIFLGSNRRESMLSPSSNRRSKQQRGISGTYRTKAMNIVLVK